jgi:hypothetical protein
MSYERATNLIQLFETGPTPQQQQVRQVVIGVGNFKYIIMWSANSSAWTIYYGTSGQQATPYNQTFKSFSEAFNLVGQTLAPSFPNPTTAAPAPAAPGAEEEEEEDPSDRHLRRMQQRFQKPGGLLTTA